MTTSKYPTHLRAQRSLYNRTLDQNGLDAAVVYAGQPAYQFLDDNTYPFKVNPLFKAWLPVTDAPDSFVIHRPGNKPTLLFCQPVDYWHAVPEDPSGEWTEHFDIKVIRKLEDARAHVPEGNTVLLGDAPDSVLAWDFKHVNPEPVLNTIHFARAWKSEYEIDCMAEASRLGVRGHIAARDAYRDGRAEFGIHLAYLDATDLSDNELPYNNIIALNEHGAVLHYTHREREAPDDIRSFLIDAGAQYRGYASDITRTYASRPGPFADLVDAVDKVQQTLCDGVRAGTSYVALHEKATHALAEVLVDAQIIKTDAQSAVASGLATRFFPHGLGHYLGLQVHDVGGFMGNESGTHVAAPEAYPALRLTRTIEASQVMTIEPGIYFIPQLLDPLRDTHEGEVVNWGAVDELLPFGGVRIEDNVVATAGAPRNLTREAFAEA
ncbi:MAG: Xaa-Pro dipeptidase [Pseudomonadota bacterium]